AAFRVKSPAGSQVITVSRKKQLLVGTDTDPEPLAERPIAALLPEPACTASLAATLGPLRDRTTGRRVGVLACGSNIGQDRFDSYTSMASLPPVPC
ncbi:MAG: hypothetical protein VXW25_05200, partial [Pseudomonadota bacterium]|nr:hypothetical protein [Pseudomonadota bacterium]